MNHLKRIVTTLDKLNPGKRAYAIFVLCAMTALALPAQTFTTLLSFNGTDGADPHGGALIQTIDGDLYGTTSHGGANQQGTVFKITPDGTQTTLYSFCSQSGCRGGKGPFASLLQGADGDFYGTTYEGGGSGTGVCLAANSLSIRAPTSS